VTGASSGIGLCTARALVLAGATVAMAARTRDKLFAEASRVSAEAAALFPGSPRALAVPMDVTDDESVTQAIAEVRARLGRIDVVINNAGNGGALGPYATASAGALRALFEVHVFGMERVTRAVLPAMLAEGGGTIVNIVSAVAWVGMPNLAAYSGAKAAVLAFSDALRGELEGQVDVIVFGPPHTATDGSFPLPIPIYQPVRVADELVRVLRRDRRRVLVGGGLLLSILRLSPRLAHWLMKVVGKKANANLQRA